MLSLVSYDSSEGSDNEEQQDMINSDSTTRTTDVPNGNVSLVHDKIVKTQNPDVSQSEETHEEVLQHEESKYFNQLPAPRKQTLLLDTSQLLYSKPATATKNGKNKVKITIPALSDFLEKDLPRPMVQKTVGPKKSGLVSILPPPVHSTEKMPSRKLMPDVIRRPPVKRIVKPIKKVSTEDMDESDTEESNGDFFQLGNVIATTSRSESAIQDIVVNPSMEIKKPEGFVEKPKYVPVTTEKLEVNKEAIMQLCGNKRRRMEDPEIIDINEEDVRPDIKDWMIKHLTEETNQLIEKMNSGPEPCNLAKRKHQITYLAHQARVNEIELKNQWAQNRVSRQQTQSKYGF